MNPTNPTNPIDPPNSVFSSQTVTQATLILIIATVLSRVFGFVREMVIAHMFGATAETDAFLIAFIIPGVFADLVSSNPKPNTQNSTPLLVPRSSFLEPPEELAQIGRLRYIFNR